MCSTPAAAVLGGPMAGVAYQQMSVRRKPLTAQEEEQRRSQSMAWRASRTEGEDPYKILPQARLDKIKKMPPVERVRQRRREMGYRDA